MNWQQILPHLKLAASLVLITLGFHTAMYFNAGYVTNGWLKIVVQQDAYTDLPSAKILNVTAQPPPQWAVRLQEQYDDVRRHSGLQLRVYKDLQDTYYAATFTWTVLAAVAALLGIFVVKEGWEKANPFLINAALTITLMLTFWQAIPKMLSLSSNIAAAKKSFLACVQLANEIRSFAQQSHTPADGKRTADAVEAEFINSADKHFSEIRNFNFDIDPSQAPDYRKAIQDEIKPK